MSLLVVGTVALDSVKTPFGNVENALGGSATYFSTSASYFTDVRLVAVIGEDFPKEHIQFLKTRNIDIRGLQQDKGKTFHWKGEYGFDLNEAHTLATDLNVLATFKPHIIDDYRSTDVVFLANIDPEIQLDVLRQVEKPKLVACDTMNYWISSKPEALKRTLGEVDLLTINEAEIRQLAGEASLVKAARKVQAMGPKIVVVKQGSYGALLFNGGSVFSAPAYPLETVFDPTGAGDTFAGGFMGYLANAMNFSETSLRQAVIFGSVMASLNVEAFSLDRLRSLDYKEIEARYREFKKLTHFEDV
ncbi:MAG: sugar kinase [Nitrospirae bacterium GWC2_57_13]|nr:MAG: sugar kinase [Nitrospirae bacterium GWC2_57_13]HAS55221.1 sugar kinase [Nitrospiraceae bacterium]